MERKRRNFLIKKRERSTGQAATATCGWWRLVPSSGRSRRASTAPMAMLFPPPPALLTPTQLLPPLPALLWSSPIRSPRSPPLPLPRDVVATAARRRRRRAGRGRRRGRRRWEVAGLRRGGVLGRAVRGGGRRAVRLVPALRRAQPLRPPLRAAGVPDPHGRLRLRAYATPPKLLPSSSNSTRHTISTATGNSGQAELPLRRCFAFF